MSGGPSPPTQPHAIERFKRSLEEPGELPALVRYLLEMRREDASHILRGTTSTAFRRIHEHITSAIDRALEVLTHSPASGKLDEKIRNEVSLLFTRGYILVNYQEARGQLSRELADRIKAMISRVLDELRGEKTDAVRLRGMLNSMRTLMDAMAVLVYRHAR